MLLGSNPILILLSSINLPLLRNLNHLSSSSRPLFIGFIDGPFVIFLSIISGQTGCWECFEQRMLASLKDHVLYNRFFNLINKSEKLPIYNLQLTNLIHIGLQEVITWNQIEMSKFMGRALFIYLPTYEIHFHNIDRISSCNYCGYISQNIFNLNNIKLDHVLKDYISLNKDK